MFFRPICVSLVIVGFATPLPAAVLVVANTTGSAISFIIDRGNGTPDSVTLAAGESKPFTVGRHANLTVSTSAKPTTHRLDAYSAYVFAKEKGVVSLRGIDLAGKPVSLAEIPERLPEVPAPLTVKVKLYADDANPFVQSVWEPKLRKRMEKATAVISAACGVHFEIARWHCAQSAGLEWF